MRSWKFWLFAATVASLWWGISRQSWLSDDELDTTIAFGIAVAFFSASLGMVAVRRDWTARSLGMFGAFFGGGLLYLAISGIVDRWQFPLSDAQLDGLRSLLLVSGVLFNVGVWRWALAYRFGRTSNGEIA